MSDDCKQVFTEIKLGRKYRYVVYRLTDDLKQITVESKAGVGEYSQVITTGQSHRKWHIDTILL